MRHLLSIAALLVAALLAPAADGQAGPESWTGEWHGALTLPTGRLRLVLTISEGADGGLTGEAESPDQAPGRKIAPTIAIANGRLSFSIAAIGANYEGVWRPDARRFSGTFSQALPAPRFHAGAGAADPVVGAGRRLGSRIVRNGVDLRLILRIVTGPRGTIALLDSPDCWRWTWP